MESIQVFIDNKEFMEPFIATAEECYKWTGDFEDVFDNYEDELTEDQIGELLEYCDNNNLISY
jgi:hypothetical protein